MHHVSRDIALPGSQPELPAYPQQTLLVSQHKVSQGRTYKGLPRGQDNRREVCRLRAARDNPTNNYPSFPTRKLTVGAIIELMCLDMSRIGNWHGYLLRYKHVPYTLGG